jgi:hypothetical protein
MIQFHTYAKQLAIFFVYVCAYLCVFNTVESIWGDKSFELNTNKCFQNLLSCYFHYELNFIPRTRLPNLLTKYVPRGIKIRAEHWRGSWMNGPEQASNGLFPWKRGGDDDLILFVKISRFLNFEKFSDDYYT